MLEYRREIDGLRAIAVLPVVFFHAGLSSFPGGFVGVDVFFVISGYLITATIIRQKETTGFSLASFYERRARRIFPALFLVVAACIPFAWLWLTPLDMKDFSQSLMAASLFVSNILFWTESGYFDTSGDLKPLLHTWSLSVEEQFYLFYPLLLLLAWPLGKRNSLLFFSLLGAGSLLLSQLLLESNATAAFYLLPSRGWELLLGALTAMSLHSTTGQDRRFDIPLAVCNFTSGAGLLLIALSVLFLDENMGFPGALALLPTAGAVLIIAFARPRTIAHTLLVQRPLVGVGLISYSLYLWHQPLFAFARYRSTLPPSTATFLALAVASAALAFLSWKWVERPCRDRSTIGNGVIYGLSVVGTLAMLSTGLVGNISNGFSDARLTDFQNALLSSAQRSPMRSDCHANDRKRISPEEACVYFGSHASWATFGDSHTVELAYALAERLKDRGIGLKQLSYSGCPPTYGIDESSSGCSSWTKDAMSYLITNPDIKSVVVSYRINRSLFGEHEGVYPNLPDAVPARERELRWQSYAATLTALLDAGKRVILVLQAPELKQNIQLLIKGSATRNIVGMEKTWWDKRNEFVRTRLGELPKNLIIVSPDEIFCASSDCYAVRNGASLYFDDHHMSVAGAALVAEQIISRLDADHGKWVR